MPKKVRLVPEEPERNTEEIDYPNRPPSRQQLRDAMRVKAIKEHKVTDGDIAAVIRTTCEHDWDFRTDRGILIYTCRKCGEMVTKQ